MKIIALTLTVCLSTCSPALAGPVDEGRVDAYNHIQGFLGMEKTTHGPAGTTLERHARLPVEDRHAYAGSAVATFEAMARRLGMSSAAGCYAGIGRKAGPAIDWLTETGSVPPSYGVLATLRRMCVGDDARP